MVAGERYDLAAWYTSTAPASLTVFRQSAQGWSYWGDLGVQPASAAWRRAGATTPPVPEGTLRLAFGLSLGATGSLTTDDYSAARTTAVVPGDPGDPQNPVPPIGVAIDNPWLLAGGRECLMVAGWGQNAVERTYSTDVPDDAPAGARSLALSMTGHVSGDVKAIVSETVGCAPAVEAGVLYEATIRYRSTSAATTMTAFKHDAAGWSYWTDLAPLPATTGWEGRTVTLPEIPAGVDRVSFGVAIAADGELLTTGPELARAEEEPVPGGEAAQLGRWDVQAREMPVRAMHTTLLSDGRVLLVAGSGNDRSRFDAGSFTAAVWDPTEDTYLEIDVPYDMFCSGHLTLPDGKVLISGGTQSYPGEDDGPTTFDGTDASYYFDPADDTFHPTSDMAGAHWYPTLTKLGNGDVWAAGGIDEKAEGTVVTEMFDTAAMRWLPTAEVPQTWSYWGTYPHMYLMDDGMLFYAGAHTFGNGLPGTGASLYDWRTAQIWDVPGLRAKDLRDQAASVLLPPAQDQRVLIVGGGHTEANAAGISLSDVIDLSDPAPAYTPVGDLPGPGKTYVNLVNLPDRTVLAANGATHNRAGEVRTAALFDPGTDVWTPVVPDPVGRSYHSTAVVLADGRVAVFGANPGNNSYEMRVSLYSPPYLFGGERPTIVAAPASVTYGQGFALEVDGDVASASLMSPMSSTHQTDTNARLVDLPVAGEDVLTAQVPDNPDLLPPGPYMLTVLDTAGIPSVARWVWVA
ncbi:secreted protein [Serinibacter arcticus]|uniref:Secreted protein n=1 Tax=Serinibacter arcticus TaxID=1655435 RepID=A0A4Z1E380_9MICO|nr:secreted protein [Serinibacter arcticus]